MWGATITPASCQAQLGGSSSCMLGATKILFFLVVFSDLLTNSQGKRSLIFLCSNIFVLNSWLIFFLRKMWLYMKFSLIESPMVCLIDSPMWFYKNSVWLIQLGHQWSGWIFLLMFYLCVCVESIYSDISSFICNIVPLCLFPIMLFKYL